MAIVVRAGLHGIKVDGGEIEDRIGTVLVLGNGETSALAALLAEIHDTEPRLIGKDNTHYLAPNHHKDLLAIRKAAYGY